MRLYKLKWDRVIYRGFQNIYNAIDLELFKIREPKLLRFTETLLPRMNETEAGSLGYL